MQRARPVEQDSRVRGIVRGLNVVVAALALASAGAVLWANWFDPAYAARSRDDVAFAVVYAAAQLGLVVAFARNAWFVGWIALVKMLLAYLHVFVMLRDPVGFFWMAWTPGRWVYAPFVDDPVLLWAFLFLGRGLGNTLNAFYLTAPWWMALRARTALLGRLVTAVFVAGIVSCVYTFFDGIRFKVATDVAQRILHDLPCDDIRSKRGQTTTGHVDVGKDRYDVQIAYDCPVTRVVVRDPRGRVGLAEGARLDCCEAADGT